jgi:hypothetical protein
MPHLVVSISGHGFGHVAQTAPILNLLYELLPSLRLTVRSSAPLSHLRTRIRVPFDYLNSQGDIGMVMESALSVSVEASRAAYRAFHADWEKRVAEEAELLQSLNADRMFSNVGYLPLAGAQRAGIPNSALCSLNWYDIYRHCCGDDAISAQILGCYQKADVFMRATPGMEMGDLPNLLPVAPIATVSKNRRSELDMLLNLTPDSKLVLVSMGGIATHLPVADWPRFEGVRYLLQGSWQTGQNWHPDAIAIESLPLDFSELLASCDALLCKPGYGSFVEAACSGIPVLYANREDWPESLALIEWLNQHTVCREVSNEAIANGSFIPLLHEIWDEQQKNKTIPVHPDGVRQVAEWLAERLKVA